MDVSTCHTIFTRFGCDVYFTWKTLWVFLPCKSDKKNLSEKLSFQSLAKLDEVSIASPRNSEKNDQNIGKILGED